MCGDSNRNIYNSKDFPMNETIIKTKLSPKLPFKADLIDELEVFNNSTQNFTKCEHWGWNEEGENGQPYYDFGIIGDFDFDIYKDSVRFYYGDSPPYGVFKWEDTEITFLPRGSCRPEGFLDFGYFDLEHTYKEVPKTLEDFLLLIIDFHHRIKIHKEYLQQRKTNTF